MRGKQGGNPIRTFPRVQSVDEFCRLRNYWLSTRGVFSGSCRQGGLRNSLLWQHGPIELERRWKAFQSVVQQIWQAAGVDSAKIMKSMALRYEKLAEKRQRVLRSWEVTHMRKNDCNGERRLPRMKKSGEELVSVNLTAVACHQV